MMVVLCKITDGKNTNEGFNVYQAALPQVPRD
jgi:hypothetical protein